jgi:hypothetical protein
MTTTPRPVCPNWHTPDHFLVPLMYMQDGELLFREESVVMETDGTVTNRWYDGTVGVSADDRKEAEESEIASCPICGADVEWMHE